MDGSDKHICFFLWHTHPPTQIFDTAAVIDKQTYCRYIPDAALLFIGANWREKKSADSQNKSKYTFMMEHLSYNKKINA